MGTISSAACIIGIINPSGSSLSYHPPCRKPNRQAASGLVKQTAPGYGSEHWHLVVCPVKQLAWSLAYPRPGSMHLLTISNLHADTLLEAEEV